jgi:PIN domain nuclease of toxin-antitoxin system
MLNLDTHILVFALTDQLRPKERALLSRERWGISGIVLWEIAKLFQLGRIEVDLEDPDVVRALSRVHVWPIDLAVCQKLRALDFQGDPADEMIAATSIVHGAPLVTRDSTIRKSKLVPLA